MILGERKKEILPNTHMAPAKRWRQQKEDLRSERSGCCGSGTHVQGLGGVSRAKGGGDPKSIQAGATGKPPEKSCGCWHAGLSVPSALPQENPCIILTSSEPNQLFFYYYFLNTKLSIGKVAPEPMILGLQTARPLSPGWLLQQRDICLIYPCTKMGNRGGYPTVREYSDHSKIK